MAKAINDDICIKGSTLVIGVKSGYRYLATTTATAYYLYGYPGPLPAT